MPQKMGAKNGSANSNGRNGNSKSSVGNEWKWINIALSHEDVEFLDNADTTLEYLAACAVSLAADGIGFKIEAVDDGKSIRCTIYRPNFGNTNVIVGVSSYSSTVRDALLACLYKLDTYLGGDFSAIPDEILSKSTPPRFR